MKYWIDKSLEHRALARKMAGGTGVVVVLLAFGIAVGIHWLLKDVASAEGDTYWLLGAVAVFGTLLVYGMRLRVRFTMSQFHLHEDARQRAIMTQAYLALLKEGNALKDDDRSLVLEMLFRPVSAGLIREDGAATPVEALASKLSK